MEFMRKLLIHIGYPKTATTTLQTGLLAELHRGKHINFLGRAAHTDNKIFNQVRTFADNLYLERNLDNISFNILPDVLNVLSEDILTGPQLYRSLQLNNKVADPIRFPKKLAQYFYKQADEISILVTIRNQVDAIISYYIQSYASFLGDRNNNNIERHLFDKNGTFKKDIFSIYNYAYTLNEYASYFGRDRIRILIYEDLLHNNVEYYQKLSDIFGISIENIKIVFENVHYKKRIRSNHGYIFKHERNTLTGKLMKSVINNKLLKNIKFKFKRNYGDDNSLILLLNNTLSGDRIYTIDDLSEHKKNLIINEFRNDNIKFSNDFGFNQNKLEQYGYI